MVFEFIMALLEVAWPRLGVCLLLGFVSGVAVMMFDVAWWKRLIAAVLIFVAWAVAGVVLEIIVAGKKRRASNEKKSGLNSELKGA